MSGFSFLLKVTSTSSSESVQHVSKPVTATGVDFCAQILEMQFVRYGHYFKCTTLLIETKGKAVLVLTLCQI